MDFKTMFRMILMTELTGIFNSDLEFLLLCRGLSSSSLFPGYPSQRRSPVHCLVEDKRFLLQVYLRVPVIQTGNLS